MNVKIACVGKLKDRFYEEAASEYAKRLSRFCSLTIAEVMDEKAPESLSPAEEKRVKEREGERLLAKIRENEFVVCLTIDGKRMTSEAFSAFVAQTFDRGASCMTFVIGGSLGLSERVLLRANASLSLSDMTLPHRLCRVFLLEQIYRAFKIEAREPYHK